MDPFTAMLVSFGYLGAFASGFLSTFTVFIPSPTFIVVSILAATHQFNPLLLGVVGGAGAAIGEFIGYFVGYGAGMSAHKWKRIKWSYWRKKIDFLFKKYHPDVVIFVLAALPVVPFDVAGIFCGAVRYDIKRFTVAMTLGKILKYVVLAYAGFYGVDFIMGLF
ncbi:MAG: VTT domain-containing protein [Candidatus Aenigmatarchaeota archaeon]